MSDRATQPESLPCQSGGEAAACHEIHPMRSSQIAPDFSVRRGLPLRQRRLVGPWCFLDELGPLKVDAGHPLDLPPHPHIGLQTLTWLVQGELLHRDSLGSAQPIRPGQLNLMSAGRGIAHSEQNATPVGSGLHGLQLWIAQPEAERHSEPGFAHHPELPELAAGDARGRLLVGELGGAASPARVASPALGVELEAPWGGRLELPLEPRFEHALVAVSRSLELETGAVRPGALHHLGGGRDALRGTLEAGTRLLLIGGVPFGERILMWWNFVAREPGELATARADWQAGRRFGPVPGYPGVRLAAPPFVDHFSRARGAGS